MAAPQVLLRCRNLATMLSRYSDVLPSIGSPASLSPAGVLPDLRTFLLGLHSGSPCHSAVVHSSHSYPPCGLVGLVHDVSDMDIYQVLPSTPKDVASTQIFAGLTAGAGIISVGGYLYSKDGPDNKGDKIPPAPSSRNGSGIGGAGGNGGGDDGGRYLKILELLLELCQREDNCEEIRDKFQQLKCLILREWHELHKKRVALNAKEISVDTASAKNDEERLKLDAYSEMLKGLSSRIDTREAELEQRVSKICIDEAKLRKDRAVMDDQLLQAELVSKKAAEKLYRADLDAKTVNDMWVALRAEQAKMAAADLGKTGAGPGNEGDARKGKPAKEEGHRGSEAGKSVFSKVWKFVNIPLTLLGVKDLGFEWWTAVTLVAAVVSELPNMDRETFSSVEANLRAKQQEKTANSEAVLVKWGLKKDSGGETVKE